MRFAPLLRRSWPEPPMDRSGGPTQEPRPSHAESSIEHLGSNLAGADESWSDCRSAIIDALRGVNSTLVLHRSGSGSPPCGRPRPSLNFIDALTESAPRRVAAPPLAIVAVSGNPPAVVTVRGVDELPAHHGIVSRTWSSPTRTTWRRRRRSHGSLDPLGSLGRDVSASAKESIGPDQAFSFHPPPWRCPRAPLYSLEVTVTGPRQAGPAVRSYRISVDSAGGPT